MMYLNNQQEVVMVVRFRALLESGKCFYRDMELPFFPREGMELELKVGNTVHEFTIVRAAHYNEEKNYVVVKLDLLGSIDTEELLPKFTADPNWNGPY